MNAPFLMRAAVLFACTCAAVAACGRSDLLELTGPGFIPDGGFADVIAPVDVTTVDVTTVDVTTVDVMTLDVPEETTFLDHAADVGPDIIVPPKTCGDHTCDDGETCLTCPEDCGVCPGCGDGRCDGNETCASCSRDCGVCPGCGNGVCTPPGETCYSCPADCGSCPGCGDGVCESDETCASCQKDCGPCSTCGNGTCDPFEDCANCPADCGACTTTTCLGVIQCTLSCSNPVNFVCITDCLAGACPSALSDATNVVMCATANLAACDGGLTLACIDEECPGEIEACLGNTCLDGGM